MAGRSKRAPPGTSGSLKVEVGSRSRTSSLTGIRFARTKSPVLLSLCRGEGAIVAVLLHQRATLLSSKGTEVPPGPFDAPEIVASLDPLFHVLLAFY